MGLSVAIAGGIVMVTIMFIFLSIPNLVNTIFSIGEISSESSKADNLASKTEISVEEMYTKIGSPRLNFTLNNDGSTTLWDFKNFNVLIEYTGAISGKKTQQLSYFGECLGAAPPVGQWCIQSISNDVADPKLLNFGETANIRTSLTENLASLTAIVAVATDSGVTFKTSGTPIETSIPSPNVANPKKWGQFIPQTSGPPPTLLIGQLVTLMTFDGVEAWSYDGANSDSMIASTSAAGGNNNAGMDQRTAGYNIYRGDQDAKIFVKFKAGEITNQRMFIGFRTGINGLPNAADNLLNGLSGVGLCINTTSTIYQLCRNDGDANTNWESTGITEDVLVHTVEVYSELGGTQWCLKMDTYSPLCTTAEIPAAATLMYMNVNAETSDATSTVLNYYNVYTEINPP
ncbi:MAG: hypothetical protein ACREAJ_01440 [Nitrosopumilaceae archaeon]